MGHARVMPLARREPGVGVRRLNQESRLRLRASRWYQPPPVGLNVLQDRIVPR